MNILCEWVFTNRTGLSKRHSENLEGLNNIADTHILKMKNIINEKYNDTIIKNIRKFDTVWDECENEEQHEDVRVSFVISKHGRKGIKEREVYSEVNKIQVAYFTTLKNIYL